MITYRSRPFGMFAGHKKRSWRVFDSTPDGTQNTRQQDYLREEKVLAKPEEPGGEYKQNRATYYELLMENRTVVVELSINIGAKHPILVAVRKVRLPSE